MENEKLTEDNNKELLAKIEELESKISALEDRAEQFGSDVKSMRSSFEGIKELSGIAAPTQISSPEPKAPIGEAAPEYPVFRFRLLSSRCLRGNKAVRCSQIRQGKDRRGGQSSQECQDSRARDRVSSSS